MYEFLEAQHGENPTRFQAEWVEFDLVGRNASDDVWDLLDDYGCFHGSSHVHDPRPEGQQLMSELLGDCRSFPMGRVFAFNHDVKSRGFLNGFLLKRHCRTTTVVINTASVSRLRGNPARFEVLTDQFRMYCDGNVTLIPSTPQKNPTDDRGTGFPKQRSRRSNSGAEPPIGSVASELRIIHGLRPGSGFW
jgi:hypothetical protein